MQARRKHDGFCDDTRGPIMLIISCNASSERLFDLHRSYNSLSAILSILDCQLMQLSASSRWLVIILCSWTSEQYQIYSQISWVRRIIFCFRRYIKSHEHRGRGRAGWVSVPSTSIFMRGVRMFFFIWRYNWFCNFPPRSCPTYEMNKFWAILDVELRRNVAISSSVWIASPSAIATPYWCS